MLGVWIAPVTATLMMTLAMAVPPLDWGHSYVAGGRHKGRNRNADSGARGRRARRLFRRAAGRGGRGRHLSGAAPARGATGGTGPGDRKPLRGRRPAGEH